ncbi:hypothetical protein ACFL34_00485 [Candidatus Sumerlaeota bacterium]
MENGDIIEAQLKEDMASRGMSEDLMARYVELLGAINNQRDAYDKHSRGELGWWKARKLERANRSIDMMCIQLLHAKARYFSLDTSAGCSERNSNADRLFKNITADLEYFGSSEHIWWKQYSDTIIRNALEMFRIMKEKYYQ